MIFANLLFICSALLTVGSAILVALTKNIMHSCIFLLGTLIGVAGLFLTLGADFVAATQIMVYVGGVVILMLFAIMLTGGKEFMDATKSFFYKAPYMGSKKTFFWGCLTAIVLFLSMFRIVRGIKENVVSEKLMGFESTVDAIGISLLSDHVLAFELSSVLLLGSLIGAAVIARARKGID